jgi:hypothetical protein
MVGGLRRCAGLNLLSYAAMSKVNKKNEVFMWFVSSLRSGDKVLSHYSDGLTGCGDSVLKAVRRQFFKLIKAILIGL